MRKKTDGPGIMASGFQDELRGCCWRVSKSELGAINAFRAERHRPPLDCSPGLRFLVYGKNKEGYWNAEQFIVQVNDVMDAMEALHPGNQLLLEVCA